MATKLEKQHAAEVAALEAKHELETHEDKFVTAKESGEATRADRADLRAARHDYRVNVRKATANSVQPGKVS